MSLAPQEVNQVISEGQPNAPSQTSFAQYAYKPLQDVDEIRLLRIEPGSWESNPQCTLFHHRLPQCPPFEALSYVWGSEEKPCKIDCGDSGTLAVTRNCFAAIKRLRKLGSLVVWIDAACIDQENDLERGHQVRNMPDIYKAAKKVLVYLGEANDDGDDAMEILRLYKWIQPSHPDMMIPLRKLMQRSWFERIWVLQEVNKAHAVSVICGEHAIPWDPCFRLLLKWGPENFLRKEVPYVLRIRGRDKNSLQSWDLINLLDNTRSYKCTDPRDRVFALLSMSSEHSRHGIEPDYTATIEDVYIRVATEFLNHAGLDLLAMVDHGNRKSLHLLPSWVPDWSPRTCTSLAKATDCCINHTSRNGNLFLTQQSTLLVHGQPFGTIHDLGRAFEPDDSGWDEACMEDWWRLLSGQYPDANLMDLSQILHMSITSGNVLFTGLRAGPRGLTRLIADMVLKIMDDEGERPLAGNTKCRSDSPELLWIDAFLEYLGEPQVTIDLMETVQKSLENGCKNSSNLPRAGLESFSSLEIMDRCKDVLFDEISKWVNYITLSRNWIDEEELQKWSFSMDSLGIVSRKSSKWMYSKMIRGLADRRDLLQNKKEERAQHAALTTLVRVLSRRKSEDSESSNDEDGDIISRSRPRCFSPCLFSSESTPYAIMRASIERDFDLLGHYNHLPQPNLQKRLRYSHLINLQRIHECCKGCRLVVTEGFTAFVPANAQKGDFFCFLSGGSFPVLLREVDGREIFVGAGYVLGDMKIQVQGQRWFTIT